MRTAVIFDLDGTLLDTLEDLYLSVNATLRAFNLPERTREEVRAFVGNGIPMLIRRALPEAADDSTFNAALEFFTRYYGEHCTDNTGAYDKIPETLSELKSKGFLTGVVTNKIHSAACELCEKYFAGLVDVVQGQAQGFPTKPDPTATNYIVKKLGADRAVYIGDSEVDIQTAKNAGVPCISVSWGFKDRAFLKAHGAEAICDTTEQVLSSIYKMCEI